MIRIVSGIAWAVFSCIFLWLFSLAQVKASSNPPTAAELLASFSSFSFMLLGGGACYHFLVEIMMSPLTSDNAYQWRALAIKLILMMFTMVSIPIVILSCRDNLPLVTAFVISLIYMVTGFLICFWLGSKLKRIFVQIRTGNLV